MSICAADIAQKVISLHFTAVIKDLKALGILDVHFTTNKY
jgi:hypothetical protein